MGCVLRSTTQNFERCVSEGEMTMVETVERCAGWKGRGPSRPMRDGSRWLENSLVRWSLRNKKRGGWESQLIKGLNVNHFDSVPSKRPLSEILRLTTLRWQLYVLQRTPVGDLLFPSPSSEPGLPLPWTPHPNHSEPVGRSLETPLTSESLHATDLNWHEKIEVERTRSLWPTGFLL